MRLASTEAIGSSRSRTFGSVTRVCVPATRYFSPPERFRFRSRRSLMFISSLRACCTFSILSFRESS
ncbi:MAG: hypothetical protein R2756_08795 [Bacteroidales bacterium]